MSQENVEIVRTAFVACERGELGEMLESMADDLTTLRVDPDDAIYHGKEGTFRLTGSTRSFGASSRPRSSPRGEARGS